MCVTVAQDANILVYGIFLSTFTCRWSIGLWGSTDRASLVLKRPRFSMTPVGDAKQRHAAPTLTRRHHARCVIFFGEICERSCAHGHHSYPLPSLYHSTHDLFARCIIVSGSTPATRKRILFSLFRPRFLSTDIDPPLAAATARYLRPQIILFGKGPPTTAPPLLSIFHPQKFVSPSLTAHLPARLPVLLLFRPHKLTVPDEHTLLFRPHPQ